MHKLGIDIIIKTLKDAGINFERDGERLITFWQTSPSLKLVIYIYFSDEWVNFVCPLSFMNIDNKKESELYKTLLRINARVIGPKFAMDGRGNLFYNYELFEDSISSESFKRVLLQIINGIKLLHETFK